MRITNRPGSIEKLWGFLVTLHEQNPQAFENPETLRYVVAQRWKSLQDKSHCPNCKSSMQEYEVKIDFLNALLIIAMGKVVSARLNTGMSLSEANEIHVVSLPSPDSVRHRTANCRTLGLIAKVLGPKGQHDRRKGWALTKRGFAALRGEMVPAKVSVFRNTIEERFEDRTTLMEVIEQYKGRNKELYTGHGVDEWVTLGKLHEGEML